MTAHTHARLALLNPATKREYNRRLFQDVAPRYNLITRLLSFGRDAAWKRWMIEHLPVHITSAMDLACGTGDITRALSVRHPDAAIVGLDLTPEMLEIAKRQSPEKIRYLLGDMTNTGSRNASYDLVTGGYALRNAPDLESALQETVRILHPGGTAAFLDFSAPENRWLRKIHYLLLLVWGAFWGLILHGNPRIYAYIARSLERFPNRASFFNLLESAGLVVIESRRFMLGMIEVVICRKPLSGE